MRAARSASGLGCANFVVEVLLFDGVEELDAVGPWEVLAFWRELCDDDGVVVRTVSPGGGAVRCAKGLRIVPDDTFGLATPNVLVHPGGIGTIALAGDGEHIATVRRLAGAGTVLASVCTGSRVLAAAGLLAGRAATSHWRALDDLRSQYPDVEVRTDVRWVDEGPILTAAGVSAGIDLALHLVERFDSPDRARQVAREMEYAWTQGHGAAARSRP